MLTSACVPSVHLQPTLKGVEIMVGKILVDLLLLTILVSLTLPTVQDFSNFVNDASKQIQSFTDGVYNWASDVYNEIAKKTPIPPTPHPTPIPTIKPTPTPTITATPTPTFYPTPTPTITLSPSTTPTIPPDAVTMGTPTPTPIPTAYPKPNYSPTAIPITEPQITPTIPVPSPTEPTTPTQAPTQETTPKPQTYTPNPSIFNPTLTPNETQSPIPNRGITDLQTALVLAVAMIIGVIIALTFFLKGRQKTEEPSLPDGIEV